MIVALTQSEGRLEGLQARLEALGFTVRRAPLVRTETVNEANLEPLRGLPWWLFTSVSAVEAVAALGGFAFSPPKLAAVGSQSAAALHGYGLEVALVPAEERAEALALALLERGAQGPFGWPCGDRARPELRHQLEAAGREVRAVTVYRTLPLPFPEAPTPDVIVLASPSAVAALPETSARAAHLVALGPSTAEAIRARGLEAVTASAPSEAAVLEAIQQVKGQSLKVKATPTAQSAPSP